VVLPILGEREFEALLGAGDLETAAQHLVVPPASLIVEPGGDGPRSRAAIACNILKRPVTGRGSTLAEAILEAWANRLIMLRLEFGLDLEEGPTIEVPRQDAVALGVNRA